jgi:hypothetical protein
MIGNAVDLLEGANTAYIITGVPKLTVNFTCNADTEAIP